MLLFFCFSNAGFTDKTIHFWYKIKCIFSHDSALPLPSRHPVNLQRSVHAGRGQVAGVLAEPYPGSHGGVIVHHLK